jgi:hypothetical protein
VTTPHAGHNWVELVATVLLALATVATAWSVSVDKVERRTGEGGQSCERAAHRFDQGGWTCEHPDGNRRRALPTQWVNAYAQRQQELANFYFKRFRKEFKPAVNAWIATRPLKNPKAPLTPLAMPQYKLAVQAEAEQLNAQAELFAAQVRRDIQRSSNYVLMSCSSRRRWSSRA